jgi:hypothetical protein
MARRGVIKHLGFSLTVDLWCYVEFAFGYIDANNASSFVHRPYLPRMQALAAFNCGTARVTVRSE